MITIPAPTMNPNSANQWWSLFTITVTPAQLHVARRFIDVRENSARFMRKAFGGATQMNVEEKLDGSYVIQVRTEGHPAHDPALVKHYAEIFLQFYTVGFGVGTKVETTAKLEAGSRQDGTPSDQLLILPTLRFQDESTEEK